MNARNSLDCGFFATQLALCVGGKYSYFRGSEAAIYTCKQHKMN